MLIVISAETMAPYKEVYGPGWLGGPCWPESQVVLIEAANPGPINLVPLLSHARRSGEVGEFKLSRPPFWDRF